MITLEPCRLCGKKDALQVTEKPFHNRYHKDCKMSVKIECKRCGWSIESVVPEEDRARAIWNSANRKEKDNGERSGKDRN